MWLPLCIPLRISDPLVVAQNLTPCHSAYPHASTIMHIPPNPCFSPCFDQILRPKRPGSFRRLRLAPRLTPSAKRAHALTRHARPKRAPSASKRRAGQKRQVPKTPCSPWRRVCELGSGLPIYTTSPQQLELVPSLSPHSNSTPHLYHP